MCLYSQEWALIKWGYVRIPHQECDCADCPSSLPAMKGKSWVTQMVRPHQPVNKYKVVFAYFKKLVFPPHYCCISNFTVHRHALLITGSLPMPWLLCSGSECWPANWKLVVNSLWGHLRGLWAKSPVGGVQEATDGCFSWTLMFSLSLSPSFPSL